ncbi:AraC family transcriptional regulator ligand-binding domain-containing protein [Aureispira sp. CCB-E]|uniref:AraC family transcriptional regulator ligand-binding domain-containing protein n=1 Tax=Aureispira sp. CCB-E TaxID=3051121 RepID=UPI002868AACD|nr:AraC family transcriptional regulator ligand-binding domain-containing protein [Aureispira sp. CCB-E]WMX13765.1 AraC family transcriptional regulator ligand-binding domain-containing protein [Aureispira sp. CCB-E]
MKISATLLAALIDFASYRGIPSKPLYALVHDANIDWCAPDSHVTASDYLRVLKSILEQSDSANLGFYFGQYLNLSALGIVHQISLQAKSMEQALLILQTYLEQQFPLLAIHTQQQQTYQSIELNVHPQALSLENTILESSFMLIARELTLILPPNSLALLVPPLEDFHYNILSEYALKTGSNYAFEIDLKALQQGINSKNLQQIEILLPQYLKMLHQNTSKESFTNKTKCMMLHLCSPALPSMQMVCEQLALSSRSLQRKLHQEGSSFRAISTAVKRELAEFLEAGKQMKIQDIAYVLGYSEPSAYIHARNNWQNK